MKSILMIGMGKFGHLLCMNMAELDNEIMIVDEDEERLADLLPIVTSAQIGDCTNVEVLKSLGIRNFDVCFVCISGNFQNSLEITSLLKELGASYVVRRGGAGYPGKVFAAQRGGRGDLSGERHGGAGGEEVQFRSCF